MYILDYGGIPGFGFWNLHTTYGFVPFFSLHTLTSISICGMLNSKFDS